MTLVGAQEASRPGWLLCGFRNLMLLTHYGSLSEHPYSSGVGIKLDDVINDPVLQAGGDRLFATHGSDGICPGLQM